MAAATFLEPAAMSAIDQIRGFEDEEVVGAVLPVELLNGEVTPPLVMPRRTFEPLVPLLIEPLTI